MLNSMLNKGQYITPLPMHSELTWTNFHNRGGGCAPRALLKIQYDAYNTQELSANQGQGHLTCVTCYKLCSMFLLLYKSVTGLHL